MERLVEDLAASSAISFQNTQSQSYEQNSFSSGQQQQQVEDH